jgi:hypothetical protein
MRHVVLLPNCEDSTCRLCPTFSFSLSPVSLSFSHPLTHTILFLSFSPLVTTQPPPPPSLQKPEHNTQLKTMCPKATYSEPQDRLRDFRDCLWVLYTVKISSSHELFFPASFDLYLSCTTFEIACGFSIHNFYYTAFLCILSSFLCVLPNLCILSIILFRKCNLLSLQKCVLWVVCVCGVCVRKSVCVRESVFVCACVCVCVCVCIIYCEILIIGYWFVIATQT